MPASKPKLALVVATLLICLGLSGCNTTVKSAAPTPVTEPREVIHHHHDTIVIVPIPEEEAVVLPLPE